ncbi:MAG: hypothetical protein S4CHLAM20_11320 [Chlamydiia bacterium]|nr:hypothetical protein [Chlamydiia bacterium]
MSKASLASYQTLCTEFYDLDKPSAPQDALTYYLKKAKQAHGSILEPMCGSGRFLIPLAKEGFKITGFDSSKSMLDLCLHKSQRENLTCGLYEKNFETFESDELYDLIFIPSGSFGLLTSENEINKALESLHQLLTPAGKLILEIETIYEQTTSPDIWQNKWLKKDDGSILSLNHVSNFNKTTSLETTLCRYELWQNNKIIKTEVEEFVRKLYQPTELDNLLDKHGFKVSKKLIPYTSEEASETAPIIIYECMKY